MEILYANLQEIVAFCLQIKSMKFYFFRKKVKFEGSKIGLEQEKKINVKKILKFTYRLQCSLKNYSFFENDSI